mmetsp:Transcript_120571/g.240071  ORF Transcript_120571/g.240071 Transcript_120571/m.240071 type:complete len:506 (+) Transcript_120571:71-1588(+)
MARKVLPCLVSLLAAASFLFFLHGNKSDADATISGVAVMPVSLGEATDAPVSIGSFVINVSGLLYMFVALYVACDEFFVPSLDVISRKLGLSADVAGATFMAAGGSAPEFFTSVVGALSPTPSDVGIAAIVGSAVFNVLFVIGCCGLASPMQLRLTGYPLTRDCIFYLVALGFLVWAFLDAQVEWHEAVVLFFIYLCYCTFMAYNSSIQNFFVKQPQLDEGDQAAMEKFNELDANHDGKLTREEVAHDPVLIKKFDRLDKDGDGVLTFEEFFELRSMRNYRSSTTESLEEAEGYQKQDDTDDEPNEPISFCPPEGASGGDLAWYVFTLPLILAMGLTVPDVRRKGFECLYVPSFILSIVWIALFSKLMVQFSEVIGAFTGIPVSVLALTLLAWGTSVPDLLTSVLVTWQGHGDMAVSSSIGSNIFDVTVGLPVPWMIYSAIHSGAAVQINSSGMGLNMTLLVLMVAATCGSIMLNKWVLSKALGSMMLVLWVAFQGYMIYNVYTP